MKSKFLTIAIAAVLALFALVPAAPATTYTNLLQGTGTTGLPGNWAGGTYVLRAQVDLSTLSNKLGAAVTRDDVLEVLQIPSNATIVAVSAHMSTLATLVSTLTNGATVSVGDGADADGWVAAFEVTNPVYQTSFPTRSITATSTNLTYLNTTTNMQTNAVMTAGAIAVTPAYGLGKLYTTNDTLNITFSLPPGELGVLDLKALCTYLP